VNERGTKRRPLKGAVLFTVLCVMAVILIMMLVTIGLSGVASRRAYSEYYDSQINATGRSVVNSVLKSLDPVSGTNKDLGKTIYNQVRSSGSYEVHVSNNGNLGQGLGRVDKIVFEKAGIDSDSDFFVTGSDYMIMKVSATITMGNKTTTYTEYVSDMAHVPGKNGGNGGLLSTAGADTSGTGMSVLGPFGGGFKDYEKKSGILDLKNDGAFVGQTFFAQSIVINTEKTFMFDSNTPTASYDINDLSGADYQGIAVLGDVQLSNNKVEFVSKTAGSDVKSIPYIFCTGKFTLNQLTGSPYGNATEVYIGSPGANPQVKNVTEHFKNTTGNKVNLYCGSFEFTANNNPAKINVASDIYCYNNNATSILGGANDSSLTNWIANQIADGSLKEANTVSGNIYTKGDLKLLNSKVTVDGDINIDGKLDLTKINTDSTDNVPAVTGKIYCSSVDPANYATMADGLSDGPRKTRLSDLISKIEITTSKFPADMDLDKILGVTFDPPVTSGSEQLSAIDNKRYNLSGAIDFSKKIVQNPLEMNTKFYDPSTGRLRNSYAQSGVAPGSVTYTDADIPLTISSQCTISGSIKGKVITFEPRPKTENKELWITLDNVSLETLGSTDTTFLIKSKVDDGTGHLVEAGPVCFYIKDGTNLTLYTRCKIITDFYNGVFNGHNNSLAQDLSITNGSMSYEYIPNVYIYGSNDEAGLTGSRETIFCRDNTFISAYIIAPRAALEVYNMGDATSKQLKYEGIEYKDARVGIVGSAIVGPITQAQNKICLLYVDNSAGGTPVPPSDMFKYQPLPGFTNY